MSQLIKANKRDHTPFGHLSKINKNYTEYNSRREKKGIKRKPIISPPLSEEKRNKIRTIYKQKRKVRSIKLMVVYTLISIVVLVLVYGYFHTKGFK